MDSSKRSQLPERNPKTFAEHRREVFWQITLPLIFGFLLLLAAIAAIIFSATQPAPELNRWADVSLMWMILPALFLALLILIIVAGFVYLITMLLRLIPRYARAVQLFLEAAKTRTSRITDFLIEPFLRTHSILAVLHRLFRSKRTTSD